MIENIFPKIPPPIRFIYGFNIFEIFNFSSLCIDAQSYRGAVPLISPFLLRERSCVSRASVPFGAMRRPWLTLCLKCIVGRSVSWISQVQPTGKWQRTLGKRNRWSKEVSARCQPWTTCCRKEASATLQFGPRAQNQTASHHPPRLPHLQIHWNVGQKAECTIGSPKIPGSR